MTLGRAHLMAALLVGAAMKLSGHALCVTVETGGDRSIPAITVFASRMTAMRVFGGAGISVDFVSAGAARKRTDCVLIRVEFVPNAPACASPSALAYALPYQHGGTQIRVFLDRALGSGSATQTGIRLGYVVSHEIGHILEGIARHSESGVMKASWNNHDLGQMLMQALRFEREDVELMREGVEVLRARAGGCQAMGDCRESLPAGVAGGNDLFVTR